MSHGKSRERRHSGRRQAQPPTEGMFRTISRIIKAFLPTQKNQHQAKTYGSFELKQSVMPTLTANIYSVLNTQSMTTKKIIGMGRIRNKKKHSSYG